MKPFFIILLIAVSSCGANRSTSISYGKTSVSDLVALKGDPIEVKETSVSGSKILIYPEKEHFQTSSDVVTYKFREPTEVEKNLIYWQHKFKDCNTKTRSVTTNASTSHVSGELELLCEEEGISVTYTDGSPFVSRVIEYAKK